MCFGGPVCAILLFGYITQDTIFKIELPLLLFEGSRIPYCICIDY